MDKFDQYVQQHFGTDQQFNVFVVIRNMDGSTLKGMLEGMKENTKKLKQYNKVAMINEKKWGGSDNEINELSTGDFREIL